MRSMCCTCVLLPGIRPRHSFYCISAIRQLQLFPVAQPAQDGSNILGVLPPPGRFPAAQIPLSAGSGAPPFPFSSKLTLTIPDAELQCFPFLMEQFKEDNKVYITRAGTFQWLFRKQPRHNRHSALLSPCALTSRLGATLTYGSNRMWWYLS